MVAATTGLLEIMEPDELEGVLAHELSHVGNYDIRFMAIVAVVASVIAVIADFLMRAAFFGGLSTDEESSPNPLLIVLAIAGAILAPLAATIVQLAISRQREYLADASGALLTRYPEGLARALEKLAQDPRGLRHTSSATAHLYISSPFGGRDSFTSLLGKLFATHPPLEERIARLRAMDVDAR